MASSIDRLQVAVSERYQVEREIGRGGMATVYLARDLKHNRAVAIKVLLPEIAYAVGPERFRREIDLATQFSHPHILPLYDSGEFQGGLYYVMPFVEGESLRARLDREGQLGIDEAARIGAEVAEALDYAHRHGIIHRDIKPENVLLEDGHALVADFGIARAVASAGEDKLTQTGVTLGTPTYMSPEQAMADRNLDGRSDIYSLGCVLYEMLGGQPPFVGPTAHAIIARHAMDTAPSLAIVRNTIPEELEDVVMRSLAKVPADRFQTAREMADALRSPTGQTMTRRAMTRTHAVPAQPKRAWLPWAIAAAVVVAGVGGFVAWRQTHRARAVAVGAGDLDPRRLAVMYFEDNGAKHDLGYVADGLTEALIGQLSDVQGLSVVSKGGVTPYRTSSAGLDSVARALNVGTLVRGGVEENGDKLRVTVRLVDGASGADFQRATFEQPAKNYLAIRDSLAQEVARMIRERLGAEVRLRETKQGTQNPDAWAFVQRSEQARNRGEEAAKTSDTAGVLAAYGEADSLLARAASLDPSWVEPVAMRGFVDYKAARFYEGDPQRLAPWIDKGIAQEERALAMAPDDPDALEYRGTLRYLRYLRNLEADPVKSKALLQSAREDLERAVRINPSQAGAWSILSHLYYQVNDVTAAKLAARKAYEVDAYLSNADVILWRLFTSSFDLEQFPEAAHWCEEGGRRFPRDSRFVDCRLSMMATKAVTPDVPLAWRLADSLVAYTPEGDRPLAKETAPAMVAAVLARAGLADSARHVLGRINASPELDPTRDVEWSKAFAWNLLGDKDQAIKSLSAYIAANPGSATDLNDDNNWMWRNLRDDPRFQALSQRSSSKQ